MLEWNGMEWNRTEWVKDITRVLFWNIFEHKKYPRPRNAIGDTGYVKLLGSFVQSFI